MNDDALSNPINLQRLLSLDVFRGLTIALMILVNSPGSSAVYPWLTHSHWNGCTLADLVFPFFIIIVGMSSVLGLSSLIAKGIQKSQLMRQIIWRTCYLFIIGLLLNAFPHHFDLSHLRILGVLQRIAICYGCSAFLFLTTSRATQLRIFIGILVTYYLILIGPAAVSSSLSTLSMDNNLVGSVDRLLLSSEHLYTQHFDPEGLLSTLPAIASALLGNLIGFSLISTKSHQQTLQKLLCYGSVLLLLGWMINPFFPINKSLWSSSYVLWTGGWACLVFAVCYGLIEQLQWKFWSKPFNLFGRQALLVYVLHVFFLKVQAIIFIQNHPDNQINLREYLTSTLLGHFSPVNASLFYAVSYTIFWLIILAIIQFLMSILYKIKPKKDRYAQLF